MQGASTRGSSNSQTRMGHVTFVIPLRRIHQTVLHTYTLSMYIYASAAATTVSRVFDLPGKQK